jgi:hypothetical protein
MEVPRRFGKSLVGAKDRGVDAGKVCGVRPGADRRGREGGVGFDEDLTRPDRLTA